MNTMRILCAMSATFALAGCGAEVTGSDDPAAQAALKTSCDDGNVCTNDAKVRGQCTHTPVADGAKCGSGSGSCQAGTCTPGVKSATFYGVGFAGGLDQGYVGVNLLVETINGSDDPSGGMLYAGIGTHTTPTEISPGVFQISGLFELKDSAGISVGSNDALMKLTLVPNTGSDASIRPWSVGDLSIAGTDNDGFSFTIKTTSVYLDPYYADNISSTQVNFALTRP